MFKAISNWLFPKQETIQPTPAIGEKWIFFIEDPPDPWGNPISSPVTIKDVKDGWVRYYMNSTFLDNRRPLKVFLQLYRKVADVQNW